MSRAHKAIVTERYTSFPVISRKEEKMNLDAKAISQRIKQFRKDNGLTQQQFADKIGISMNFLSKIESGMKIPSIDVFVEIAVQFEVSLDWVIMGKEHKLD